MKNCFYCDYPLKNGQRTEWDHFPVPKCAGGTETVPSCHHCHREKTHMTIARLLRRISDSAKARTLSSDSLMAFVAVTGWPLELQQARNLAEREELVADDNGETFAVMRKHWHEWPQQMRVCAGAALEELFAGLAFERKSDWEWLE
jgi:hypothetical protein